MISGVRDALSFLTILPLPCPLQSERAAGRMGRALAWFPLAGALIGALAGGVAWFVWREWSQAVGAWAGLAALAILTGALHLDGFADTLDGFGAWKGKEKTLEIMRDSRIGTVGAVGLILLLGLQWSLLREFDPGSWVRVLTVVCALSRFSMVLSAHLFPYVPGREGLGRVATDERDPVSLGIALVSVFALSCWLFGLRQGVILVAAATAVSWLASFWVVRRLGGITGDTLGAVNELTALVLLLALSVAG